jgi:Glyoxalase-like domain
MRIDHVIVGTGRIEDVADRLRDELGFGLVKGTAHGDGTQGWLVPFDSPDVQYLEVLSARDPDRLEQTGFGREFLERTAGGPCFLNWAVATDDVEADAERLRGLLGEDPELIRGESVRETGERFPWIEVGFAASWRKPCRPFVLEYGNRRARGARVPGDLARAAHRVVPRSYAEVEVESAGTDVAAWLGDDSLPVRVVDGHRDRVRSIAVATSAGEARIRF